MRIFPLATDKTIPDDLLAALTAWESPNVFNPWRDTDPMDVGCGCEDRRWRLRRHFATNPLLLLIGEAPGYQGCHFSGVPFTNENLICRGLIPRIEAVGRFTARERPFCEPSATIVWGELRKLGVADRVVMWNAFAWHPHRPGNVYSNRAPTGAELADGLPVLRGILDHFAGVPVVPVGKVSEKILNHLGVDVLPSVRHPAMGGAGLFRSGLAAIVEGRWAEAQS